MPKQKPVPSAPEQEPQPMQGTDKTLIQPFNQWMTPGEVEYVCELVKQAPPEGDILELGAWEGYLTIHLANTIHPRDLHVIDHWQGQLDEGDEHPSVLDAQSRDVYAMFQVVVDTHTKRNVRPHPGGIEEMLRVLFFEIAFCWIDSGHTYATTKAHIEAVKPLLVPGAILCGHDFVTAHAGRADLGGGVERAVRETLPGFTQFGNIWVWRN